MVPFTLLAQRGCTSHASLALSLTAEFAPLRAERAEVALDGLAVRLEGARDDGPEGQLHAAADLLGAHLEALALDCAIDDLLLDRVVIGGAGHPLLLAVAAVEAGRRAGLALGHVAWALRAAELRLALPFEGDTRERLEADLRRVRARLN
jgi:hypothetical protein